MNTTPQKNLIEYGADPHIAKREPQDSGDPFVFYPDIEPATPGVWKLLLVLCLAAIVAGLGFWLYVSLKNFFGLGLQ